MRVRDSLRKSRLSFVYSARRPGHTLQAGWYVNPVLRHRLLQGSLRRNPPATHGLLIVAISLALGATLLLCAGVGIVFAAFISYSSGYTPLQEVVSQRSGGLTEIYDRGGPDKGVFLGTLTNPDGPLLNPVPLDQISPNLIDATISTEDNSFWSNPGIDFKGLLRAAWDSYLGGGLGSAGGGSTITQQLVKNVYLTDQCTVVDGAQSCIAPHTLTRKLKELTYALKVTQQYSKQQILSWYLNQISYGSRYVGIQAAAQGYFRVDASALDLAQASLLAGVPQSPTLYHPRLNCVKDAKGVCVADAQGRTTVTGAAKARQQEVLSLMVQHGWITAAQEAQANAEVLKVYPAPSAPGSSAWIDDQIEPRLVRMCEAGILPQLPGTSNCTESVHTAGYRVTTTLNFAETQKATALMNQEISSGLSAGCDCHNAAVTSIDPATGQVMVYAPNIDPTNVSDPQVAGDIDQLVEINQPGSSFKPAVYLAYFQLLQKTPMSSIWDTSPLKIDDPDATPANQPVIINSSPGGGGQGLITARSALGGSQNVPAFRAAEEVGIDNVIKEAKALGITTLDQGFDPTFYQQGSISYGPSIATGGANVRAIDMAYMNATIANMGVMIGVPTLAKTLDPKDALSLKGATGDAYDKAVAQRLEFVRGNLRLPGTRQLDPVVVLNVQTNSGQTIYQEGPDLQKQTVVDPASTWMLQSIMTDCTARWIIWTCGSSNNDNDLDAFMADGTKIPEGEKTGTQQGFSSSDDTLATWMNGFNRYAATAVWVGNSNKTLVHDGARWNFASADTTIRLFKNWMSEYLGDLQKAGVFSGEPANFDSLKPANVALRTFQSATTERGHYGGCYQQVTTWVNTDLTYKGDCQGTPYMPLPADQQEAAIQDAWAHGILIKGHPAPAPPPPPPAPSPSPTASASPSPSASSSPTVFIPTPSATAPGGQPGQPSPQPVTTPVPPPTVATVPPSGSGTGTGAGSDQPQGAGGRTKPGHGR